MIHLIDPSDIASLSRLKKDDVVFPNIDYSLNPNLNRRATTIKAAYSIIVNQGYGAFLEELEWNSDGDIGWQNRMLQKLSNSIHDMISTYHASPSDYLATKIFIWIQLWGGSAGRNIFVMGGGFDDNFDIKKYKESIKLIANGDFKLALEKLNSINKLSTSFSTKHIYFWSNGNAPILDRIISNIVFGRESPLKSIRFYQNYINTLDSLALKLNNSDINRQTIERNLFNWAETAEGEIWCSTRVPESSKTKKARKF